MARQTHRARLNIKTILHGIGISWVMTRKYSKRSNGIRIECCSFHDSTAVVTHAAFLSHYVTTNLYTTMFFIKFHSMVQSNTNLEICYHQRIIHLKPMLIYHQQNPENNGTLHIQTSFKKMLLTHCRQYRQITRATRHKLSILTHWGLLYT